MTETLSGPGNVEKATHWCPTYQNLQRGLSKLERVTQIIPGLPSKLEPEIWGAPVGYWPASYGVRPIITPEVQETKVTLYQHRTTCEPCVTHFSPQREDEVEMPHISPYYESAHEYEFPYEVWFPAWE